MADKKTNWMDYVLEMNRCDYDSLPAEPSFVSNSLEEIMLPMSDGISLSTFCQKPQGKGPFPTIVMRSCYPEQDPLMTLHAAEYSRRGYAFVWQHCRGTGRSEGNWVPYIHERQDGKDTLDWLDSQNWISGIGYWGNSYLALTGWTIADILPEKVKTLYLTHCGTDRFNSAYQCGLFRQDVLTSWAMSNSGRHITADYQASLRFRPHIDVDEKLWGGRLDWYREWITATNRDDEYWQSGFWHELQEIPARIKVPVYLGGGWYDHHLGSVLRTWQKLSPEAKAHSMLRIGAWNHGFMPCVQGRPTDHVENSDIISAFHWFDHILRRGETTEGCVRTYQIGADRWQVQPAYPFAETQSKTFFLAADNGQASGSLHTELPLKTDLARYIYDPENPVPSHGAESLLATMRENGSLLQPACGWRNDVVSFVSEPLADDIDILGKIKVVLHVTSSADDTAFSAKIMEIGTDGQSYNIRSGITTLAYRHSSDETRCEYIPGTAVEAMIELWDISWKLRAGCRLRVDISSSDFPQYAIHTNYAGIWSLQDKARSAEQTILTGAAYPSKVVLPVTV